MVVANSLLIRIEEVHNLPAQLRVEVQVVHMRSVLFLFGSFADGRGLKRQQGQTPLKYSFDVHSMQIYLFGEGNVAL